MIKVAQTTKDITVTFPKPKALSGLPLSGSGKSYIVATTSGNMVTDVEIDGQPMTLGLNAYVKKG